MDARPGLDRTSVKQAIAQAQKQLKSREKQLQSTLQRIHEINTEVARAFNPRFGMVFKCHDEHSIVVHGVVPPWVRLRVGRYACYLESG